MSDSWKPALVENWRPGMNNSRVAETQSKADGLALLRIVPWGALVLAALMLTAFVVFGAQAGSSVPSRHSGQTPASLVETS